jgi:probable phosphoglycerate mutase
MIYLIRHGQTEHNVARRYQGSLDSPLTALGAAQARAMGLSLRSLIDPQDVALFSSPLGRALETAQLVAEDAGIPGDPIIDEGLAEISLGSWDGLTIDQIEERRPEGLGRDDWYFQSPDGERYDPFETRLAAALARITAHPAATRIIISHGVASRVLRGLHAGLPREEALALPVPQGVIYRLDGGAITEIDCTDAII